MVTFPRDSRSKARYFVGHEHADGEEKRLHRQCGVCKDLRDKEDAVAAKGC